MIDTHLRYEHIKDPGMYMALLTDRLPGGRDEFGVFSRTNMREWKVGHVSSSQCVVAPGLTRIGSQTRMLFDWAGWK